MRPRLLRLFWPQISMLLTLCPTLAAAPLARAQEHGIRPSAQGSRLFGGHHTWGALQWHPQGSNGHFSRAALAPNGNLCATRGDSSRPVISARLPVDARKQRDARLAWVFLGTTVLAGGASMYLKSAADDQYDRYLHAGSPEAMNRYYDEALRLDRYAATAYGTFQVSFLLWVYFFLKSR